MLLAFSGLDPLTAHQKAVRVDAVGGAGHQGDIIHPLCGEQLVGLGRQHNGDLIDLIGQHPIQHRDGKAVAHLQLVQIGEQLCTGQAAVRRYDRMRSGTAHGQAAAFQMACCHLQHALIGAVVYGQLNADFGDRDIPHNARAGDVERLCIAADQIRFIKGIGGGV